MNNNYSKNGVNNVNDNLSINKVEPIYDVNSSNVNTQYNNVNNMKVNDIKPIYNENVNDVSFQLNNVNSIDINKNESMNNDSLNIQNNILRTDVGVNNYNVNENRDLQEAINNLNVSDNMNLNSNINNVVQNVQPNINNVIQENIINNQSYNNGPQKVMVDNSNDLFNNNQLNNVNSEPQNIQTEVNVSNKSSSKRNVLIVLGVIIGIVVVALISYLFVSGKKLECNYYEDNLNMDVMVKFRGNNPVKLHALMEMDLSDSPETIDLIVGMFENQYSKENENGVNVSVYSKGNSVFVEMNARDDKINSMDIIKSNVDYKEMKEYFEKEGYTCK